MMARRYLILKTLFADASLRSRMAAHAAKCLETHHGATRRTVAALESLGSANKKTSAA